MYLLFYNLFLFLYKTGIRLISPWNPKARLWLRGRKDIFSQITTKMSSDQRTKRIWMHCASLGEFEQGRPVLEALREKFPDSSIILTFFSPSGFEVRKHYSGADHIFYLPIDSASNARRFVDIVKPSLVIWVKYEYWYYFLHFLHSRNIPLVLISAIFIPSQVFFKWYGALHRRMLEFFSVIFVQMEASRVLLAKIGVTRQVEVSGDTRFDRVSEIAAGFKEIGPISRFCGGAPVVVAGSTWQEDEEQLDHYANMHPEIKFIIAPHETGEDRIQEIEKLFRRSIRYSSYIGTVLSGNAAEVPNVLIIDNIGMLSRLYKYASIAYIGGGFGDEGVHNVLEAAVYGKPVIFGPVFNKFIEPQELIDCGGGFGIGNALQLEKRLNDLLQNNRDYDRAAEASGIYVQGKRGAKEKIMQYILSKCLV